MKQKEMKELLGKSRDELQIMLTKLQKEVFDFRLNNSQRKLKNTQLLFHKRKDIARIFTRLREMEFEHGKNI